MNTHENRTKRCCAKLRTGWGQDCQNRASRDGYCGLHHPDVVARIEQRRASRLDGRMHDISGMTVRQHHEAMLGVLALCYRHVPEQLRAAILQGLEAAEAMGAGIKAENVKHGLPLRMNQ